MLNQQSLNLNDKQKGADSESDFEKMIKQASKVQGDGKAEAAG